MFILIRLMKSNPLTVYLQDVQYVPIYKVSVHLLHIFCSPPIFAGWQNYVRWTDGKLVTLFFGICVFSPPIQRSFL